VVDGRERPLRIRSAVAPSWNVPAVPGDPNLAAVIRGKPWTSDGCSAAHQVHVSLLHQRDQAPVRRRHCLRGCSAGQYRIQAFVPGLATLQIDGAQDQPGIHFVAVRHVQDPAAIADEPRWVSEPGLRRKAGDRSNRRPHEMYVTSGNALAHPASLFEVWSTDEGDKASIGRPHRMLVTPRGIRQPLRCSTPGGYAPDMPALGFTPGGVGDPLAVGRIGWLELSMPARLRYERPGLP